MRQLRCVLAGVAGAIVAILAMLGALIICLFVISARMSSPRGEIGWDPVSLGRQQPVLLLIFLLVIIGIVAWSFVFGYRLQERRIRMLP